VPTATTPTAEPITLAHLRAVYPDRSDEALQAQLDELRSSEEIVGLEVEALALVQRGANLRPFHTRKTATPEELYKMDTAIPTAVAEAATTTLSACIDNLTAIRDAIAGATEGAEGAPEEVGSGLPESVVEAARAEAGNLTALADEHSPSAGDMDGEGEPEKAEPEKAADDGNGEPANVENADGLLAEIAGERVKLINDALAAIMSGSLSNDDIRSKYGQVLDMVWELEGELGALAKKLGVTADDHPAVTDEQARKDIGEALATVNDHTEQLKNHEKALELVLGAIEGLRKHMGIEPAPAASDDDAAKDGDDTSNDGGIDE